ncbi:MAG: hypothetical protein IJX70_02190, partial [Clostridia bacterium]|nr:hypothetical protein [Clostridia bacterium]
MKNKLGKWLVGLSLALVVALVLSLGLASTLAVADTRIAVAKPVAVDAEYVYDGTEQTFGLVLPEGYEALYEVYGNRRTEAGNQHVTVRLKNPDTHMWEDGTDADLDFIFSIGKATYDMSGVQFVNAEYTYDGTEKKVEVSGTLPAGVTVSYIANTRTDAGVSMAVATFSGDEHNYFAIPYMTASITVNKAEVAKPSPDTTEFVYDGTEKVYGVQENALWEISGNKQTHPGQYTVAVSLKD